MITPHALNNLCLCTGIGHYASLGIRIGIRKENEMVSEHLPLFIRVSCLCSTGLTFNRCNQLQQKKLERDD